MFSEVLCLQHHLSRVWKDLASVGGWDRWVREKWERRVLCLLERSHSMFSFRTSVVGVGRDVHRPIRVL